MSSIENLMGREAVEKLKDLVGSEPTCMFGSGLDRVPFHVCPMQVQQVDEAGNLWFFSGADSEHNGLLEADPRTNLIFANSSKHEYLTVFGEASISRDRAKIEELWTKMMETWFPEGKDDPNLTVIQVKPLQAHYWDTESGKLISLAKILMSSLTKSVKDDGGVEGDIRL